jgi:hypothetical protein
MTSRLTTFRMVMAMLMVIFGVIITARGLVESAPWSFVLMGALLALLGAYRLTQYKRPRKSR